MAEARADRPWTVREFLDWVVHQPERWELVRGYPVKMMVGARTGHNRATHNIGRVLGNQLLDGPCEVFGSDMAVETTGEQVRYPDVVIACGKPADDALEASDVRMVVEVFSDSTQPFDATDKLMEYQGVPTLRYILLVETRRRAVELYTRENGAATWSSRRFEGEELLDLPMIGASISMDEIYRGMSPPPTLTVLRP